MHRLDIQEDWECKHIFAVQECMESSGSNR